MGSLSSDEKFFVSEIFRTDDAQRRAPRSLGTYAEAAREIPVHDRRDVLVVGGGPSGTAAAVAAARVGVDVILLEAYNHLGGLSTGGLVIWIDRMTDWNGARVIRGFAEEVFARARLFHGDGDLFARAGAAYESAIEQSDIHHCMNTSWLFGGADMNRWLEFKATLVEQYAEFMRRGREALRLFDQPFVSWRNDIAFFMAPRQAGYSALGVEDLIAVEVRSHELMGRHLESYRAHAPGFENPYLLLGAPQLGVDTAAGSRA
jgi:FAD dependent oxidoreductase